MHVGENVSMTSGRKRILVVLRGGCQSSSSTVHRSGSDGFFRVVGRSVESVTMVTMFAMIYVADTIRTIHSSRFIMFSNVVLVHFTCVLAGSSILCLRVQFHQVVHGDIPYRDEHNGYNNDGDKQKHRTFVTPGGDYNQQCLLQVNE